NDGASMAHGLERHERTALVACRVDEDRCGFVPGMEVGVGYAADQQDPIGNAVSIDNAFEVAAPWSGANDNPAPGDVVEPAGTGQTADRIGQHVEPLVELEAADAEPHEFVGADVVTLPCQPSVGNAGHRVQLDEIDAVGNRDELAGPGRKV